MIGSFSQFGVHDPVALLQIAILQGFGTPPKGSTEYANCIELQGMINGQMNAIVVRHRKTKLVAVLEQR